MLFLKKQLIWICPILFFIAISPWLAQIDLATASWSYTPLPPGVVDSHYNGFYSNSFWDFIYHYGFFPAQAVCAASGAVYLLSLTSPYWKKWRQAAFMSVFTLIIGGAIVSPLIKEATSRPRPKQVEQFGGQKEFRPHWQPYFGPELEPSKSFPSGHSTCGFYFFWIYFLGRRMQNRRLALFGLVIAFSMGGVLSLCRILQGGHFVSDVLATALLMWEIAFLADKIAFEWKPFRKEWYEAAHSPSA